MISTEKKSKKQKIFEKTVEIALISTIHGLPRAFRTEKPCLKLMCLILFILSFLIWITTVRSAIDTYFNYEIVTNIQVISEIPSSFPTITFYPSRNTQANLSRNLIISCKFNFLAWEEAIFELNQDKLGFTSISLFLRFNVWLTSKIQFGKHYIK